MGGISFEFRIESFDDIAWKTAQLTGALDYMPYDSAQEYANIYDIQDEVYKAQRQVADDVMSAASLVITLPNGEALPADKIDPLTDRIGIAEMHLIYLSSAVDALNEAYQKYKAHHPEAFPASAPSAHAGSTPTRD